MAATVTFTEPEPTDPITIDGDMTGLITFEGDHDADITITGASTGTLLFEGDLSGTLDVAGDITGNVIVIDSLDGTLDIGKDLAGQLLVGFIEGAGAGSLLGEVRVFGDIADTGRIQVTGATDAAVTIYGDLAGSIAILDSLYGVFDIGGELTASGLFQVGLSLADTIDIQGNNNTGLTLAGQIVINAIDVGELWDGVVRVEGSEVDGRSYFGEYFDHPGDLGGGAIGLVPYAIHDLASGPMNGSTMSAAAFTGSADIEYYGPIDDAGGTGFPVTIEIVTGANLDGTGGTPTTTSPVTGSTTVAVSSTNARILEIRKLNTAAIASGVTLRITPLASRLRCEDTLLGTGPDVKTELYFVKFGP